MSSLYLDGLLDTDEHRYLEGIRARADLDLQHARHEVGRQRRISTLSREVPCAQLHSRSDLARRSIVLPTSASWRH